jgi:hypothetical protein
MRPGASDPDPTADINPRECAHRPIGSTSHGPDQMPETVHHDLISHVRGLIDDPGSATPNGTAS